MTLLQDLNPIPFPVVVANCMAWVAYGIVNRDPYVFLANDPGLLLGLFYTLSAYGYADAKVWFQHTLHAEAWHSFAYLEPDILCCLQTRNRLTALILLFGVALSGVAFSVASMPMSKNEKMLLWWVSCLYHRQQPLSNICVMACHTALGVC